MFLSIFLTQNQVPRPNDSTNYWLCLRWCFIFPFRWTSIYGQCFLQVWENQIQWKITPAEERMWRFRLGLRRPCTASVLQTRPLEPSWNTMPTRRATAEDCGRCNPTFYKRFTWSASQISKLIHIVWVLILWSESPSIFGGMCVFHVVQTMASFGRSDVQHKSPAELVEWWHTIFWFAHDLFGQL